MRDRRHRAGINTPVPIESEGEYRSALDELVILQRKPLGTPETEGLQDLAEAILNYEAQHKRGNGNGALY